MHRILTAIGNEKINYKLRENEEFSIVYDDIQYEEGIFEILDKDNNFEYLVVNHDLIEENLKLFKKNIGKINEKIKIIILINIKKEEINTYEDNNYKIIKYNNENIFLSEADIKELILNIERIILNKKIIDKKENEEKASKITVFVGSNSTGKTTIISKIAQKIDCRKQILIIDLNYLNKDMKLLLEKKQNKTNNRLINKINNNIFLLDNLEIINKFTNINKEKLIKILIKKIRKKYDYIFIDTNSNFLEDKENLINRFFLNELDLLIVFIIPDLIGIKRAKTIIEKLNECKNKKIKYIVNKKNKKSIDKEIIEKILNKKIHFEIEDFNTLLFKNKFDNKIIKIIEKGDICKK